MEKWIDTRKLAVTTRSHGIIDICVTYSPVWKIQYNARKTFCCTEAASHYPEIKTSENCFSQTDVPPTVG